MEAKRKRSSNLTMDEKLNFVRQLELHGNSILTKATCHTFQANKSKEIAWQKIADAMNASGPVKRDISTLKKLWAKLKSDAKVYRAASRNMAQGTGGGPSQKFDDAVMVAVIGLTGRASVGINDVLDCDAEMLSVPLLQSQMGASTSQSQGNSIELQNEVNYILDVTPSKTLTDEETIIWSECDPPVQNLDTEDAIEKTPTTTTLKRRFPEATSCSNERVQSKKERIRMNNLFASGRAKAEDEKVAMIVQQREEMTTLSKLKIEKEQLMVESEKLKIEREKQGMANDKLLFARKMEILNIIKKQIEDGVKVDAATIKNTFAII